jgi:hypothetical protein
MPYTFDPGPSTSWLVRGSRHERLGALYFDFARKEFSHENLLGYFGTMEILGDRPILNVNPVGTKVQKAQLFYAQFLDPNAKADVNVNRSAANDVLSGIQKKSDGAIDSAIRRVQKDLFDNLTDVLSRFKQSQPYQAYCASVDQSVNRNLNNLQQNAQYQKNPTGMGSAFTAGKNIQQASQQRNQEQRRK